MVADNIAKFRYQAVCGLEYQTHFSSVWWSVTPEMMMTMTAQQLREIADVMEANDE